MGNDVLIVVSKLKAYVKGELGLSTSATVAQVLSDRVKDLCRKAAESANKDKRKTLMDRDFDCGSSTGASLVVVSKLKAFVKADIGLSTSGSVPSVLTAAVETMCKQAAENATKDKRKTLMDRDFANIGSCCGAEQACSMDSMNSGISAGM